MQQRTYDKMCFLYYLHILLIIIAPLSEPVGSLTEYSIMSPVEVEGGSHERWAPSPDLEILIAEGAPGKPGRHVLNADTC